MSAKRVAIDPGAPAPSQGAPQTPMCDTFVSEYIVQRVSVVLHHWEPAAVAALHVRSFVASRMLLVFFHHG
eukprot:m.1233855 g.1233855  ORF g.1233855 m.1233855 type:complete len:71 (+) comp24663_c0_seq19:1182-1394(+)